MDLDAELRVLDRIRTPDLKPEIRERTQAPSRDRILGGGKGRRAVAIVVAFGLFAGAAAFGWQVWNRTDRRAVEPADPWGWAPEGWSELPLPPEVHDGALTAWTGDELVVWGGWPRGADTEAVPPSADGFALDPGTRDWSPIAPAPVGGGDGLAAWTGSEILFWNVRTEGGRVALAFDPQAGTWRRIPQPPNDPRWGGTSVWTGSELIVWGGGLQGSDATRQGAAFDPRTNTWRALAEAPVGLNLVDAVWDGTEMVVVGSEIDNGNHATTRTAIAMTYDPALDSWRRLPDPPISPQTSAVAYVDGRLVAWEAYSPSAAEFLPDEDRWRSLDSGDLEGGECYAYGVTVGSVLFTWDCGRPAVWFAWTSSWVRLEPVPLQLADPQLSYSLGTPTSAGSVVVVRQVETVLHGDTPNVGSSQAPVHFWVWKPPLEAPVSNRAPTADDAANLVGNFLWAWSDDIAPYLPTYATADLLDRLRRGIDVPQPLADRAFSSWRYLDYPDSARELENGRFEIRISPTHDEGTVIVVVVGPGVTADGRDAQLVVLDARSGS